jgi:peptide-methionine (S)-S-oxide reductase
MAASPSSVPVSCCAASSGRGDNIAVRGARAGLDAGASTAHIKGRSLSEREIMAKATFAAGCFWGVESAFRQVPGVIATAVGYTGGQTKNPTYKEVCSDRTGHAEALLVEYDPAQVSYEQLLDVFWEIHDPTQLNRQGPDHGSQYRSAIFVHDAEQEKAAKASKERLTQSGKYRKPIVTEVVPAGEFYMAEDYHQQYFEKRGIAPTCHVRALAG